MTADARYLIVSDLHLTEVVDHPDGWTHYKRRELVCDVDLDALVRRFARDSPPDAALTLVLTGDVFDFDLVTTIPATPIWPVRASERRYGLDPTPDKSAWKLNRMLDDHPDFVATLGRWVADRRQGVYMMVAGTLALALTPAPLWVKLMVPLTAFPLTWYLWEALFGGSIFDYASRLPAAARHIAAPPAAGRASGRGGSRGGRESIGLNRPSPSPRRSLSPSPDPTRWRAVAELGPHGGTPRGREAVSSPAAGRSHPSGATGRRKRRPTR